MSDIRFGTKWARADYGLIVAPYSIPMPEPQTNFVEIPGRDGALDLSEAFGTVRYADRIIPLTLYARAPFDTLISALVHGGTWSGSPFTAYENIDGSVRVH